MCLSLLHAPPCLLLLVVCVFTQPSLCLRTQAMLKSMTAAGQVPHFHFCEEVQVRTAAAGRALSP